MRSKMSGRFFLPPKKSSTMETHTTHTEAHTTHTETHTTHTEAHTTYTETHTTHHTQHNSSRPNRHSVTSYRPYCRPLSHTPHTLPPTSHPHISYLHTLLPTSHPHTVPPMSHLHTLHSVNWRDGRAPLRPKVVVNRPLSNEYLTFSVLCYNILAQDLISANIGLYSDRPAHCLDWAFRRENILRELTQQAADIMCLQEVQEDAFHTWFLPNLSSRGWTGVYKKRTGSHTDGCALFYNQSKLTLVEYQTVEYLTEHTILNRDNVGIIAKFSVASGGSEFCVATTHLLYNPKAGEVKLAQLGFLMAKLHQMTTVQGTNELLPVILCGDFNSLPNSHLVNFVSSSRLDYSNISASEVAGFSRRQRQRIIPTPLFPPSMGISNNCCYVSADKSPTSEYILTHPFNLKPVYPYCYKSTVTTFHQSAFETVDYIFFSPVTNSCGFRLLHRKALPSCELLLMLGPQPHNALSSDHLFLCATFQLI